MGIAVATVNPINLLYSPIGPNDPSGEQLASNAATPLGFFGATPVPQPSGGAEAADPRGAASGTIATYSSTQSPTAVTLNTSVESNFTVQSGSGAQMVPATGDVFIVNKLAAQAGLGLGNVRFGSAGVIAVNFNNVTGSTVTPTASEVYKIIGLRGVPVTTQSLSPTAVPATTIAEQTFNVAGMPAGALLQVSKPTSQTGLDIVGCRMVSNGVVGITFLNATASPITPTAAETYSFFSFFGIDATGNQLNYGFNVGTVGAITAGVVISGGATALNGLLATDSVTGIFKPTPQAAATNVATPIYGIPTANTLTLYYLGTGTGGTPTASEVYTISTVRAAPTAPLLLYNQSLAPTSVAANTSAEQTFTVTGLVANSLAWVNKPSATPGLGIAGVRVSAANTLAVTFVNVTGAAIVPPTETYVIGNFQVPAPGAGNSVWQAFVSGLNAAGTLVNSMRSAMVSLGLIAGA